MGKKIAFLMEYPIDLPGGGQMSTWTLCEGLRERGYEPVVICPSLLKKSPGDFPFEVLEYRALENREDRLFPRLLNFASRLFSFKRLICRAKPDIVHVSMSESLLTYAFIRWLPSLKKFPFVYTDRGLCYGYRGHTKAVMKRVLRYSEGMICTTRYNKGLWEKELSDRVKITVIPNTISRVFSSYDPEKREVMRKRYCIGEDESVIGFAGRISEEKDWDFVPVLVKSLHDAGLTFKVALVISLYESKDREIVTEIKKKITDVIGEASLIYLEDLSQEEIADYYYMPDVFIMSSSFESFGKAAVEAMSRKCAVVSTSVGGLTEVVDKEENLYTKDSIDKFVKRVKILFEDPEELKKDRDFFYRRYLDNYTLSAHVDRHIALYESIGK